MTTTSNDAAASFAYGAGGKQLGRARRDEIMVTVNGITTVYVGNHYEVKNNIVTKYYFAGATRLVRSHGWDSPLPSLDKLDPSARRSSG